MRVRAYDCSRHESVWLSVKSIASLTVQMFRHMQPATAACITLFEQAVTSAVSLDVQVVGIAAQACSKLSSAAYVNLVDQDGWFIVCLTVQRVRKLRHVQISQPLIASANMTKIVTVTVSPVVQVVRDCSSGTFKCPNHCWHHPTCLRLLS